MKVELHVTEVLESTEEEGGILVVFPGGCACRSLQVLLELMFH